MKHTNSKLVTGFPDPCYRTRTHGKVSVSLPSFHYECHIHLIFPFTHHPHLRIHLFVLLLGTRPKVATNSARWSGRTLSQQLRRRKWTPPDLGHRPDPSDTLDHYSDKEFVIGNSSTDLLRRIAHRFRNGPSPVQAASNFESPESIRQEDSPEDMRQRFARAELDAPSVIFELEDTAMPPFALPVDVSTDRLHRQVP